MDPSNKIQTGNGLVTIRSRFGAISSLQLDTPAGRTQNDDFSTISMFGGLVGDFNKGHVSQICFGCILEVFWAVWAEEM